MHVQGPAPSEHSGDGKRFAFVLGNKSYGKYGVLKNPEADVTLIAQKLSSLGFEVALHFDLGPFETQIAFERFASQFNKNINADTVAVYYAGHGFQEDGQNYILTVPNEEGDVEDVPVTYLISKLGRRSVRKLLFFDACRNNFDAAATAASISKTRSVDGAVTLPKISNGLSDPHMDYGEDILLSFSAAPGKPALDAVQGSRYSPYAEALADHMESVGISLDNVLKRVNADVLQRTNSAQNPWSIESLKRPFYFAPSPLLFLSGNLMALVAVMVGTAMMLAVFLAAGAEWNHLYGSSLYFPVLALIVVLAAFGALLFGISRAYARALGARLDEADKDVELTPPLHGAIGGFLGGIIGAPLIAVPYWWVWRLSESDCQGFGWIDPWTPEYCPQLSHLFVEICYAGIFISTVLGFLAVLCSNWLRHKRTGWACSQSDAKRLLIGATLGGTLAGFIVGPPVTAFFGAKFRPFLEPNFIMLLSLSCTSIIAFSTVNYSLERFSRARIVRSFRAALIAPVLAAIPLGLVLLLLYQTGFIQGTLLWARNGYENSAGLIERYSFLLAAGVAYGVVFGGFLGLLIGVTRLLSDPHYTWRQAARTSKH